MPRLVFVVGALLFIQACHDAQLSWERKKSGVVHKAIFNSSWQKPGVGQEEWYYRMTVIDAPGHSQALTVAHGHSIYPDTIRWEITKNLLIAWKNDDHVINQQNNISLIKKRITKGAPVLAFYIYSHDGNDENKQWYEQPYMKVDWSQNLVSAVKRQDQENPEESIYKNSLNYFVDALSIAHPNRMRVANNYIDITTRHPMPVGKDAFSGALGPAYKNDASAIVLDIRHSFLKKQSSDYVATPNPDYVLGLENEHISKIAINNRFGFFRTGANADEKNVNATLFNIWKKSRDENGSVIPLEQREIKSILYYTNVLHPDDLMDTAKAVITEWNTALKSAVFYAQPKKYSSLDDVPDVLVLRKNSCSIDTINTIYAHYSDTVLSKLEAITSVSLADINNKISQAQQESNWEQKISLEIKAKKQLEHICSALEYYTENESQPFVYQRPGDLRFNLINPIVDTFVSPWSGYGPMFADSITGETLSATANINMAYINKTAFKTSQKISLIKHQSPGLLAMFSSTEQEKPQSFTSDQALEQLKARVQQEFNPVKTGEKMSQSIWKQYSRSASEESAYVLDIVKNEDELDDKSAHYDQKKDLFDNIKAVDHMAQQIGLNYSHLSTEDRFIKIRALLYKSVLLHELGHNLGLRHNMAASSDALNYTHDFWQAQQLPEKIEDALKVVTNNRLKKRLNNCINKELFLASKMTSKQCLNSKTVMSSSVMDYMADNPMSHLGYYDNAAIKWAYTQLVEVFPKNNVVIDREKESLTEWIKFNDFRLIPGKLLVSYDALKKRKYVKFRWNNLTALDEWPRLSVPYAYCENNDGTKDPRCLAFDAGPDMATTAVWLENRFWQNYIFNYFSEEDYLSGHLLTKTALQEDKDALEKFSHMARWYYHFSRNEPKFKGSYLEKDYVRALAKALNHFAHIIALPEAGAHITAPNYVFEHEKGIKIGERTAASGLMIPFHDLEDCQAKSLSSMNQKGAIEGQPGFSFIKIPLGIGRPLYSRLTHFNENNHAKYIGSSLIKKLVLYYLSAPLDGEKNILGMRQDEAFISWYKIFPEAVGKIYNSVINKRYEDIGFALNEQGQLEIRDILDDATLTVKKYPKNLIIKPALDDDISRFATTAALSFIPGTLGDDDSFARSLEISCQGCRDDVNPAAFSDEFEMKNFTHFSGYTYRTFNFRDKDSVGAMLLETAEIQKNHLQRLHKCIENNDAQQDPLCQCVKTMSRNNNGQWSCCEEGNAECSQATLEDLGSDTCSVAQLLENYNAVKEQLNKTVNAINYMRNTMINVQ